MLALRVARTCVFSRRKMAATESGSGKKKKKQKKAVFDLATFQSMDMGGGASPGAQREPPKKMNSWADASEDLDVDETTEWLDRKPAFDKSVLPSAPRASTEHSIDLSQLPKHPPYTVYLGNLSYDCTEKEIAEFFERKNLKIESVRLPREAGGRLRGFGYAEVMSIPVLKDVLSLSKEILMNRPVNIDLAGGRNQGEEGGRERGGWGRGSDDSTPSNWRRESQDDARGSSNRFDRPRRGSRDYYDRDEGYSRDYGRDRGGGYSRRGGGEGGRHQEREEQHSRNWSPPDERQPSPSQHMGGGHERESPSSSDRPGRDASDRDKGASPTAQENHEDNSVSAAVEGRREGGGHEREDRDEVSYGREKGHGGEREEYDNRRERDCDERFDDIPPRRYGPKGGYEDHPPRRGYDDRPPRGGYDDRPQRRGYDDRPPRGGYDDRPPRGGYDDRPPRRGYDDRPPRGGYDDRPPRGGYEDRPPRGGYDDRPPRGGYGDRPPRGGYDDRPPRGGYDDRPPRRGYDDRPPRGGYDDRPPRRGYDDRPPRGGYDDRPTRGGYDDQPTRGGSYGNRGGYQEDRRRTTPEREEPATRPKLQLQPRSKPAGEETTSGPSSIFGGAKPVDTRVREKQIEERLQKEKAMMEAGRGRKGSEEGRDHDGESVDREKGRGRRDRERREAEEAERPREDRERSGPSRGRPARGRGRGTTGPLDEGGREPRDQRDEPGKGRRRRGGGTDNAWSKGKPKSLGGDPSRDEKPVTILKKHEEAVQPTFSQPSRFAALEDEDANESDGSHSQQ